MRALAVAALAAAVCGVEDPAAGKSGHVAPPSQAAGKPLKCMRRFRLNEFPVGIWRTPPIDHLKTPRERQDAAELYFRHCRQLGLTVVKSNKVGTLEHWLAAAEKVGMPIFVHSWKFPEEAWGPDYPPVQKRDPRARTHYVGLGEFKWLHSKYGRHPRIAGYLLNDNCGLHDYTVAIARYLLAEDAGAIPWMSTNPYPAGQAKVPMPVLSSQNYPYRSRRRETPLGEKDPDERDRRERRRQYYFCSRLEQDRAEANRYDLAAWPILACSNVPPAHLRFQCYTALAYGAQGIWYFHVFGVLGFEGGWGWPPKPTAVYEPMRATHAKVVPCGRRLLGHRSLGVFHTGGQKLPGAWRPGAGRMIEAMDDLLLAGLLVPEDAFVKGLHDRVAVMVVDKRTAEPDAAPRAARVKFAPHVRSAKAYEVGRGRPAWGACKVDEKGRTVLPPLRGGEGVLLALDAQRQAIMPLISPPERHFEGSVQVTLRQAPRQVIRYTLDGSTPGDAAKVYTGAVTLKETATFKARAFPADGSILPSLTATMEYRRIDPMVRVDRRIDFDWRHGSPGGDIPADDFQVVWTGYVRAKRTGPVTFHTVADDGVRLWVGDTKVVDDWSVHGAHERTGKVPLTAGKAAAVKLEYFERDGLARIKLLWSAAGRPKQIVPADCLFVDRACTQVGLKGTYRIRSDRP